MDRTRVIGRSAFWLSILAIVIGGWADPTWTQAARIDPGVVPGSYIVVYRDDIVAAADVTALIDNEAGVEITHVYEHALSGFAAELSNGAIEALRDDPRIAEIVPDRKMYPFAQRLPAGADRVDADLNPFAGIDGIDDRVDADVAILDMGVGPNDDLNVVGGYDCTGRSTVLDNGGHGTHVAGIAAAKDNGTGIVGVAPGARVWSIKVLDAFDGNWSWVICGIDWVTAHADVIEVANMSLGETLSPNNQVYDGPMHRAIQRSVASGVTYVVAAGNAGRDAAYSIPARYEEVITVSAIADSDGKPGGRGPATSAGADDSRATFSNYGQVVDIAAPGVDTISSAPGGGISTMSGTSFATPHVTGAVALYIAQFGRVGPAAVRSGLLSTADPGKIPGDPDAFAEGILNVGRFGSGALSLSRASGVPGEKVVATLTDFPTDAQVTFAWDGKVAGSFTTDGAGRLSASLTVPSITKGPHAVTARAANAAATASFTVLTAVKVAPSSAVVGQQVKVILRGYAARERIAVLWENGATTSTLASTTASGSGNATVYVIIPASLGGTHTLTGSGALGSAAKTTVRVLPRLAVSPKGGAAGSTVRLSLRGFQSSETVTIGIDAGDGTHTVTTTSTSKSTGSRTISIQIPRDVAAGTVRIVATGNAGTSVVALFEVTGPAVQASEPTRMPTPTASPTQTPTQTVTATTEPAPAETSTVESTPEAAVSVTEIPSNADQQLPDPTPTD